MRKAADSDSEKSDYFFETVVQFSNTGSTFSIPNNKTYNFFYDDDSFSSALSEQERKEEIIKEKENLSLQLNAEQLKTNFDSCLIDDIVEWIATTDCMSYTGIPELMAMFKQIADIRTADMLFQSTPS